MPGGPSRVETEDVVRPGPCWKDGPRTAEGEILGAGEGAFDGVDSFAGLALCAAVGTYADGRTADGRFERD